MPSADPCIDRSILFSVDKIRKYSRNLLLFSDVSFDIYQDELVGLVGLPGFAADEEIDVVDSILRPDGGVVKFKGEDVTGSKPHKLAAKGLVRTFQKPVMFTDLAVIESVILAHHLQFKLPWWRTIFRNDQETREARISASDILDSLGLTEMKDMRAKDLRYDQKKTLGVAIALAAQPDFLIMDQPPIEISVAEIDLIQQHAQQVKDRGVSVLMIGRTSTILDHTCDRIISMSADHHAP